jgi:hypothetical protein
MGKWSSFKDDPELLRTRVIAGEDDDEQDSARREKIDAEKARHEGKGIAEIGELYAAADDAFDAAKAAVKKAAIPRQALLELLVRGLEAAKLSNFKFQNGEQFILDDQPRASYEDKRSFLAWARTAGLEDLLTMHYQTMQSQIKDRLEKGLEPPPGIKVFYRTGVQRRGKAKK